MENKKTIFSGSIIASAFIGLASLSANASTLTNYSSLGSGSEVRSELLEQTCGAKDAKTTEAKCGEKDAKTKEGKCGNKDSKTKDAKCGKKEGKGKEGKCGEGKCGAKKKKQ